METTLDEDAVKIAEMTTKDRHLEYGTNFVDKEVSVFENVDSNIQGSPMVGKMILNSIFCYKEIIHKRKSQMDVLNRTVVLRNCHSNPNHQELPLQCCCLENPREGGAWWAAVYGVAKSQTRLKRLSSSSSPPGSSVHRISQARILEWAAISSSRGSSQPRDRTRISCITWNARHILYHCTTWEVPPILHEIKKEIIPKSLFTKKNRFTSIEKKHGC